MAAPRPTPAPRWYYIQDGRKAGPVLLADLRRLVAAGRLRPADMVMPEGARRWQPARSVPGLFPGGAGAPRAGGVGRAGGAPPLAAGPVRPGPVPRVGRGPRPAPAGRADPGRGRRRGRDGVPVRRVRRLPGPARAAATRPRARPGDTP